MKCILDSDSKCGSEKKVDEMICIKCIRSHQIKVIVFLAESLRSVKMRMDRAISIGQTIQILVTSNDMLVKWLERYHPKEYQEMEEAWKKQETELKKKMERLMGRNLPYRA